MGKRRTLNLAKYILLIFSALIVAYLLLLEKGLNPKINHLLDNNVYFWLFVGLITLIMIFITVILTRFIVEPCIIHPIFNSINTW